MGLQQGHRTGLGHPVLDKAQRLNKQRPTGLASGRPSR
jgi:hypothetical protein